MGDTQTSYEQILAGLNSSSSPYFSSKAASSAGLIRNTPLPILANSTALELVNTMKLLPLISAIATAHVASSHPLLNTSHPDIKLREDLNASVENVAYSSSVDLASPAAWMSSSFVGPINNNELGTWYESGNPNCYARVSRVQDKLKGMHHGAYYRRNTFTFWCHGSDCHGWKNEDKNFGYYGSLWDIVADDVKECKALNHDVRISRSRHWNNWVVEVSEIEEREGDKRISCMEARFIKKLAYHLCHDRSQTSWWLDTVPGNEHPFGTHYPRCGNDNCAMTEDERRCGVNGC